MSDTPLNRALEIHKYFNAPENRVKIQFPSPESQYHYQHFSQFYLTARAARGGPISELARASSREDQWWIRRAGQLATSSTRS